MEKKEAKKWYNAIRPFLSPGNLYNLPIRSSHNSLFFHADTPLDVGFTLVEILIVVAIAALLITVYLVAGNPSLQTARAKDAQRMSDIRQLKAALDLYYDDHKCYPPAIPSGTWIEENGVVYMIKVPKDPDIGTAVNSGYVYQVDKTDSCPQWNVLYTTYTSRKFKNDDCPLSAMNGCNYTGKMACSLSGQVDCNYISNNPVSEADQTTGVCPEGSPKKYVKDDEGNCNVAPDGKGEYCIEQCN